MKELAASIEKAVLSVNILLTGTSKTDIICSRAFLWYINA
jgi:hypothetical protein